MQMKHLDPQNLSLNEDWEDNNAAFTCPYCEKVFIVSGLITRSKGGKRECPECHKSTGQVSLKGGRKSGGEASLEW